MTEPTLETFDIEFEPIPDGKYKGTITEFYGPQVMHSNKNMLRISVGIEIIHEGYRRSLFNVIAGYPNTIMLAYYSRHQWIGKEVDVKVKTSKYDDGRIYQTAEIVWREPNG